MDNTRVFVQEFKENKRKDKQNKERQGHNDPAKKLPNKRHSKEVSGLDRHRAEQIAQSPDMKHVTYNGQQVYIQHVHEQSTSARIFPLDQPKNEFDVHLENLTETKRGNA